MNLPELTTFRPAILRRSVVLAALLVAATFLAYAPALGGGMLWDDEAHVTRPELRGFAGLGRIWTEVGATQQYYPLLHTAFWMEHRLWGDAVRGYHVTNVALHALAALLVVALTRRLLAGRMEPAPAAAAAWLAGALFALHPLAVESVAWISEQKNTLSAVFYLVAALVYLRFDRERGGRHYALSTLLFACALLTKTVTATLPAALLVVLWWRRGRLSWRSDVAPLVPWLAAGLGAGLFTAWLERTEIGAQGAAFDLNLAERGLIAGRALCFYVGKLLWPAELIFVYPRWTVNAAIWWQWLFPLTVLAVGAMLWRRRWRGPLAGALVFAGTLFPALGFLNVFPFVYSYVADHFAYLASLGVIVPLAAGMLLGCRRLPGAVRFVAGAAIAVAVFGLAVQTWRQSHQYRDAETLWRTTLKRNPEASIAYNNLGEILAARPGGAAEAFRLYEAAVRTDPRNAPAHNNLGRALAGTPGREAEAVAHYEEALRLQPQLVEAQNNLGVLLARDPVRRDEGIGLLREAVRRVPDSAGYRENLGLALLQAGRPAEAVDELRHAVAWQPERAATRNSLGVALAQLPGNERAALEQFEAAVRLAPESAESRGNFAQALASFPGRQAEALAQFETAVRLDPDSARARESYGAALLAEPGRQAEAIAQLGAAARLNPDSAAVRQSYGAALLRDPTRIGDAVEQLEQAVALAPEMMEAHFALGVALTAFPERLTEARHHLETAARLRPDYAPAREVLEQLRSAR